MQVTCQSHVNGKLGAQRGVSVVDDVAQYIGIAPKRNANSQESQNCGENGD
jgi:hypothetical protein